MLSLVQILHWPSKGNKGKKTAWNTWKAFEEVTETFANLSVEPFKPIEDDSKEVETLERFIL